MSKLINGKSAICARCGHMVVAGQGALKRGYDKRLGKMGWLVEHFDPRQCEIHLRRDEQQTKVNVDRWRQEQREKALLREALARWTEHFDYTDGDDNWRRVGKVLLRSETFEALAFHEGNAQIGYVIRRRDKR